MQGGGHYVTTVRQSSMPTASPPHQKLQQDFGSSRDLFSLAVSTMGLVSASPANANANANAGPSSPETQDGLASSSKIMERAVLSSGASRNKDKEQASNEERNRERDRDRDKWYCLNDNLVTEVQDPLAEISGAPSAYVLFYIRKDIKELQRSSDTTSIQQLLMRQLHLIPSTEGTHGQEDAGSSNSGSDLEGERRMQLDDIPSTEIARREAKSEHKLKRLPGQTARKGEHDLSSKAERREKEREDDRGQCVVS